MTEQERTRWAMIGTGDMAGRIVEDFQRTENIALTTVASRSADNAAKFAATWGIPHAASTIEDVWAAADIDAVYIATPHPAHFGLAKAAIGAGKHVLVEKPITMTAAQARELGELARRSGVFLMEAMWTRFVPAIRKVQELVRAGEIGEVRSVQASFGFRFPFDPENRLWKAELGGGSTLDQGVYTVTIPYLLLGKPTSVDAWGTLTDAGVDSESTILMGFARGERAFASTSMTTFLPISAAIGGTTGQITLDPPFWSATGFTVHHDDFTKDEFSFPQEGNGYVPMLRAVSAAILSGQTEHELNPLADTIEVLEIIEEAVRQIHSKNGNPN